MGGFLFDAAGEWNYFTEKRMIKGAEYLSVSANSNQDILRQGKECGSLAAQQRITENSTVSLNTIMVPPHGIPLLTVLGRRLLDYETRCRQRGSQHE